MFNVFFSGSSVAVRSSFLFTDSSLFDKVIRVTPRTPSWAVNHGMKHLSPCQEQFFFHVATWRITRKPISVPSTYAKRGLSCLVID